MNHMKFGRGSSAKIFLIIHIGLVLRIHPVIPKGVMIIYTFKRICNFFLQIIIYLDTFDSSCIFTSTLNIILTWMKSY